MARSSTSLDVVEKKSRIPHPSTKKMIFEALEKMDKCAGKKKGVSLQVIKNYIWRNYNLGKSYNIYIKKCLKKALEDGIIVNIGRGMGLSGKFSINEAALEKRLIQRKQLNAFDETANTFNYAEIEFVNEEEMPAEGDPIYHLINIQNFDSLQYELQLQNGQQIVYDQEFQDDQEYQFYYEAQNDQ